VFRVLEMCVRSMFGACVRSERACVRSVRSECVCVSGVHRGPALGVCAGVHLARGASQRRL